MRLAAPLADGISLNFEAILLYVCQDGNRDRQRTPVARGSMGAPRYGDDGFREFLRRYQLQCLLKGKRRATAELDARQAAVWSPDRPAAPLLGAVR